MASPTCPNCGKPYQPGDEACRYCNFSFPFSTSILPSGTLLRNRYEIQQLIHSGGMGFVYLAKDKNLFDRICVVKQVRDRLQSKEHQEKLEEEALRMSKLNHPNVAMILDHFTEAGYYFLVVEYIRGKTLREVFEERTGPLQEIKVLQWAKSICDVLVYLHAEGVVHRDISPDNIMISSDGSIKFIDFGTLRELQKVAAGGTAGMGKFGFSPPEQWQGKPEPRSDIFALGATLYFLLTGYLPLSNEYLNGQGPQKEDFYPDFAPIRKKNPAISPQLEAILQKALSLDINKRYASASDMLRDLDSLVAKKTKPELGNSNLKGKLSKRQIYAITASIILVVGCIGTGMYYLTSYNRTASPSTTSTTSSLSAAVTTSSPPVTTSSSPVTATTSSPSVTTSSTTSTVTTPPTQPAEPMWYKTFGGTAYDIGRSIIQSADGGFAIVGSTKSYGAGDNDVWLVKTDNNGNKLWDKTFGGTGYDNGYSIIQTADGGFVLLGTTAPSGTNNAAVWLIKTDSNGNKLWDKTFGGAYADEAYSILQSGDGGFVINGETNPPTFRGYDVWLIKTDNNGNKLWDKTFGGVNDDGGYSVIQTSDGGFVIAGYTGWIVTSADSTGDLLVIKTDSTGTSLPGPATSSVTTTPPSTTPSTTPVATTTPPAAGTNVIDVWPTSGTSIQTTVNGAKSGDTIIVHSGTYHEAVVFSGNSGITLKGDGAILDGSSFLSGRGIITIQNGATNITVTGFQIIKSGEDGIWLGDANGCSISQNQISNSRNGIIINNARDNNISNNTITNSSFYGIQACLCNGNNIENNVINGNSNGISTSGTNNHILQNQITESADDSRGILVNSGLNDLANGNTVEKNIVKSNGMGIIIVGSTNQLLSNQVSSVYDGIYICFDTINNIDSKDNLIQQNKITCTHNGNSAINLVCVHNNIILQNEILNSWYGITMFGIMNNIHYVVGGNHISQNKITNSIYEGIAAWDEAVGNTIENNEVSGSGIYDLFDVSTTSPLNTWVNNTYNKKNW